MRRRHGVSELGKGNGGCSSGALLLSVSFCSFFLAYVVLSPILAHRQAHARALAHAASSASSGGSSGSSYGVEKLVSLGADEGSSSGACCRGVEHLEFWGKVVVWGDKHRTNSSEECCAACKARCRETGPCECNSWVYCGDRVNCGDRFGECWLKHQDNSLAPDIQASGKQVMWTSGMVNDKDTGIMGIETELGTIRIKILVDCAPYSIAYLLELRKMRHCTGCQIFRAEGRGLAWDAEGVQTKEDAGQQGPFALLQGTFAVETTAFKELPKESCPKVKRGSVGWIGGGPEFFISLANHDEWYPKHTVFAQVLPEDMHIVETMSNLPTTSAVWTGVNVAVLDEPIDIKVKLMDKAPEAKGKTTAA